jgi:hypothetical protein
MGGYQGKFCTIDAMHKSHTFTGASDVAQSLIVKRKDVADLPLAVQDNVS